MESVKAATASQREGRKIRVAGTAVAVDLAGRVEKVGVYQRNPGGTLADWKTIARVMVSSLRMDLAPSTGHRRQRFNAWRTRLYLAGVDRRTFRSANF
jgi:hypothetical protein